ncbi:MAG: hypothetical protein ACI358_06390 [Candidatus Limimorpha sp.]
MKRLYLILSVMFLFSFMSSCKISQNVVINGTPGTEIYSPSMERIATVQSDGTTTVKIHGDEFYSYLMSHEPNSQLFVPFALDYKRKNYTGTNIAKGFTFPILVSGVTAEFAGLIISIVDDGALGASLMGAGLGAMGLACGLASLREGELPYEYRYKYSQYQSTNEDFKFAPIVDNGIKKSDNNSENREDASDGSKKDNKDNATITDVNSGSTAARRKSIDFSQVVSGTYLGSGTLLYNGNTVESYSSVEVVIDRKAKNTVNVKVIESGESFFGSELEYSVERADYGYELTLTDISNAVISIDRNGKLSFKHPKVNIDGELYTLNIDAEK